MWGVREEADGITKGMSQHAADVYRSKFCQFHNVLQKVRGVKDIALTITAIAQRM